MINILKIIMKTYSMMRVCILLLSLLKIVKGPPYIHDQRYKCLASNKICIASECTDVDGKIINQLIVPSSTSSCGCANNCNASSPLETFSTFWVGRYTPSGTSYCDYVVTTMDTSFEYLAMGGYYNICEDTDYPKAKFARIIIWGNG